MSLQSGREIWRRDPMRNVSVHERLTFQAQQQFAFRQAHGRLDEVWNGQVPAMPLQLLVARLVADCKVALMDPDAVVRRGSGEANSDLLAADESDHALVKERFLRIARAIALYIRQRIIVMRLQNPHKQRHTQRHVGCVSHRGNGGGRDAGPASERNGCLCMHM